MAPQAYRLAWLLTKRQTPYKPQWDRSFSTHSWAMLSGRAPLCSAIRRATSCRRALWQRDVPICSLKVSSLSVWARMSIKDCCSGMPGSLQPSSTPFSPANLIRLKCGSSVRAINSALTGMLPLGFPLSRKWISLCTCTCIRPHSRNSQTFCCQHANGLKRTCSSSV